MPSVSVTFVYCVETAKDTGLSCYGMPIGDRTQAFGWMVLFSITLNDCNSVFKIKPLFDAE